MRKYLRRTGRRMALGVVLLGLVFVALDHYWPLPLLEVPMVQMVTAADGRPLRSFADRNGVWRYPATTTEVSANYLSALLQYEDRWFYWHPGINPIALLRASWQNLRAGRVVSGGSTLTMQVARILDPHERTVGGKSKQLLRALQLEYHYSKTAILNLYLTYAPFGGPLEGVQAASYRYLGKSARELSLAEAALLAVLPQAPSRLRPDRHPKAAEQARNKLLQRLQTQGYAADEITAARQEPVLTARHLRLQSAPLLAQRLKSQYAEPVMTSSIDFGLQQTLEDFVADYVARLPDGTSAAVLVVENSTLLARAYLGSADFTNPRRFGHIDMVQAIRSPGSTLKPFLYGLALDQGLIHSESLLTDAPRLFSNYRPSNFSADFSGAVSVAEALQRSLNVPAVQVLEALGPGRFAASLEQGGLRLYLPDNKPSLPLILGGVGCRLEELVGLYTALANGGLSGTVRFTPQTPLQQRRLLSEGAAWIIRALLLANPPPERLKGERWQRGPVQLAWKTGTSYGFRDAWAIGVGPRYTVGVWIGRPDGTAMPGQYGLVTAAPLLFTLANRLAAQPGYFSPQPASVQMAPICWPLGRLREDTEPALCAETRSAWILQQQTPPTLVEADQRDFSSNPLTLLINPATGARVGVNCAISPVQTQTVALWPKSLEPWLPAKFRRHTLIPPLDPQCPADGFDPHTPLHITDLVDGQRIQPAGVRGEHPRIRLGSVGGMGKRYWLINGQFQYEANEGQTLFHPFTHSGYYQVSVVDEAGHSDRVDLWVEIPQ